MLLGKRTIIFVVIFFAVPVITLTRIYTNFSTEGFGSPEATEASLPSDVIPDAPPHLLREDQAGSATVVKSTPSELADADNLLSSLEKDREGLEAPVLSSEVEQANALISEMNELISQVGIGHEKVDDKTFSAAVDEVDALQAQLLELDAAAE